MAQNIRLRQAGPQDIDAVTALFIKCMDDDENWDYRLSYRHEYPEDHWKHQNSYVEFMVNEENNDFEVWILEVETSESSWTAVALSIWDVSYVNKRLHGPSYVMKQMLVDDGRRDAKPIRNAAFIKCALRARQSNSEAFGINQLYLRILGTHPDYRRRGFGSKLLKRGIDRATRDEVVLSLMSTQSGYPLYISCGFQELEAMRIQAKDEEVFVVMRRMVYIPEKETVTSTS
ncbi:Acyl- N-acyltransferase protein [Rutstroemia sp. NJR-2017a BVV2]|nr:Acyl- N-acyltransferase protein [Rutstroemia sp. NJR-2017a BVV2]